MSSLEIDGCGNTPGAVQSWTVMVPVAVDPSDPLYLPAIFDADPGRYLGSSNTPQHAYTEEESCSPGWLGLVYEDDHSDAALNNRWLRGLSGKGSAEGCGAYVNLYSVWITGAEMDIARWYYDRLYGFRIGACGPRDALCELMESFRWGSPIMRLVAELQFRRRDGRIWPNDIERMLAFSVDRRTIIRWMDKYAVPR